MTQQSAQRGFARASCVSAGPLCASYDDFGNQVGFTDTTGAITVISPTISAPMPV
jgi:hypothetical protein